MADFRVDLRGTDFRPHGRLMPSKIVVQELSLNYVQARRLCRWLEEQGMTKRADVLQLAMYEATRGTDGSWTTRNVGVLKTRYTKRWEAWLQARRDGKLVRR